MFSNSVSLLQGLPEQKLARVVDCLEVVSALAFISSAVAAGNVCLFIHYCLQLFTCVSAAVPAVAALFSHSEPLCRTALKRASILSERGKKGTHSLSFQKAR